MSSLAVDPSNQSQHMGFECAIIRLLVGTYLDDDWEERKVMVDDVLAKTKDSDAYWH